MKIFTIGHSTKAIEELIDILKAYGIVLLVDIRTVPRSRHTPQFNSETLCHSLAEVNISYLHLAKLGGLRKTSKESVNTAWRNLSFRGYADYMQTDQFQEGLEDLLKLACSKQTAIMCAEAVPWRCHRSLVGDVLLVRGVEVIDIFSATKAVPETLTSFAKVEGFVITYPPED